jgi:hypothetical protein
MHCAKCGTWVEVSYGSEPRFVTHEDDSSYRILAETRVGTRLVHECEQFARPDLERVHQPSDA